MGLLSKPHATLTDAEVAAGTDPNLPDTDTDGFTDGEELTAGTDPLNLDSWPVSLQRFPNRLQYMPAEVVGAPALWKDGKQAKDVFFTDQYGNPLELYQLYGYNIVLSVGARWCPPCNEAAKTSQAFWTEYAGNGVVFVEVLLDDIPEWFAVGVHGLIDLHRAALDPVGALRPRLDVGAADHQAAVLLERDRGLAAAVLPDAAGLPAAPVPRRRRDQGGVPAGRVGGRRRGGRARRCRSPRRR